MNRASLTQNGHITGYVSMHLADPAALCLTDSITHLRGAFRTTWLEQPFYINGIVVLPDHIHAVLTLPLSDRRFTARWRLIRQRFNPAGQGRDLWDPLTPLRVLRTVSDIAAGVEYCRTDPVRHQLVRRPTDWPYSSIHRDLDKGLQAIRYAV